MNEKNHPLLDVAIIGGGPAGISACLELSKSSGLKIALFEKDSELGGMPRSCHIFFGMRDLRRIMTGPKYAKRLNTLVRRTSAEIHTDSTVIELIPDESGKRHGIKVASSSGLHHYSCRVILLTTGCFEISRGARMIPGTRPDGIFTTGTLQELINIRGQKPGNSAVIIGSELIALSSVLTLKKKNISIQGMIEEDQKLHTYSSATYSMGLLYKFPVYKGVSIKSILGNSKVEGIEILQNHAKDSHKINCDTIIITGKLRPYAPLIDFTLIQKDPSTLGPSIDMNFMTSVPNIFAAGNVLRGADMHDLCALEGKMAAENIKRRFKRPKFEEEDGFYLKVESPIRYVAPQKILHDKINAPISTKLVPGCSIQLEHTFDKPVIEARSSGELIWRKSYRRLIANYRIPIPLWEFDLKRVDHKAGVEIKLRNDSSKIHT